MPRGIIAMVVGAVLAVVAIVLMLTDGRVVEAAIVGVLWMVLAVAWLALGRRNAR